MCGLTSALYEVLRTAANKAASPEHEFPRAGQGWAQRPTSRSGCPGAGGPALSSEGSRTGSSSRGDRVRTPDGPSPGAGTSDPLPQRAAPGPPTPAQAGLQNMGVPAG